MVLPLIMAPGALLSFPLAHAIGRRRYAIASGFVFLAALYDITIITIWCVGVLSFFGYRADVSSVIPALLWSYSIATRPIVGMANGEDGGAVATWATVFFAQLGYAVMMLGVMAGVTPGQLVALFAVVMSGSVLVRLAMIVQLRAHTMPRAAA
jgi:hypothetical protein